MCASPTAHRGLILSSVAFTRGRMHNQTHSSDSRSPLVPKHQLFFGFALGILVSATFAATPRISDTRAFEMRTYTVDSGQLPALLSRFRDHTVEIFNRHGMTSVGYWTLTDSLLSKTTLVYIIAHASRDAATQNWAAFRSDPEWQKVAAATTAAGLVVRKVESVFMEPTDFSPIK
jgi:hypothetical protein